MRLKGKVAIVTGGGRGIGKGIALGFANEGARVVISQRDPVSGEAAAEDIRKQGGEAIFVRVDVSQRAQVDAMVAATLKQFGRIDVLVNNAGVTGYNGHFLEMTLETWQRILDINLTGVFFCGQAVARSMVAQGTKGRIINIGSVDSFASERMAGAYSAAKGGVLLLTKAMAVDLAEHGILVNCISPGSIRTETNGERFASEPLRTALEKGVPLGRPGLQSEIAAAAIFFASDESSFVTGSNLMVDGGYTAYNRFD